ncbi:immunity protein YezG family protein [Alkalihalophilus sp. As8PL]|uniref:Immunity protein YezG family protein n=1 Tax=Alkalihalophilus sp. As8PL TaxID=3237103 RepID=A0AB39BQC2_9BACI
MEEKLNEFYEKIVIQVMKMIPEEWDEVKFYGEVNTSAKTLFFYYLPIGKKEAVYSQTIPERSSIPQVDYLDAEDELSFLVEDLWEYTQVNYSEVWTNFTMSINREGKLIVDFKYDASEEENPTKTRIIWAYQHFGLIPKSKYGKDLLDDYLGNNQT